MPLVLPARADKSDVSGLISVKQSILGQIDQAQLHYFPSRGQIALKLSQGHDKL
jgi:hypothetical protein